MLYVKVVSKKGGGYMFPAKRLAWVPTEKSVAKKTDVLQLFKDDAQETGELVNIWISPDNKDYIVVSVVDYDIYVLSENGKTIDRIP